MQRTNSFVYFKKLVLRKNRRKVIFFRKDLYISDFLFITVTRLSCSCFRIIKHSSILRLQLGFINCFIAPIGFSCFTTLNVIYLRRSKSKNNLPIDTDRNSVTDSPGIRIYITDDDNNIFSWGKPASWNSTLDLDTAISVAPRLFFGHLLLKQINLDHPVVFPLNNDPNVKSVSMQNQKSGLFTEIKHIFIFISKDLSAKITPPCFWCVCRLI